MKRLLKNKFFVGFAWSLVVIIPYNMIMLGLAIPASETAWDLMVSIGFMIMFNIPIFMAIIAVHYEGLD